MNVRIIIRKDVTQPSENFDSGIRLELGRLLDVFPGSDLGQQFVQT